MLPTDRLCSLTVDFRHAPDRVRACFALPAEELCDLLCHAGQSGSPLILLCAKTTLTLISTSRWHVRAFRPVLARLRERTLAVDGWRSLPVRITSGSDAGRQLVRQAIAEATFVTEIRAFARQLRAAAELSASSGAFSNELGALVHMTEHIAERMTQETGLGRGGVSAAEIELEILAAERIVEEEIVAWQASCPELRSSNPPISDAESTSFSDEERHSMVRIRVGVAQNELRRAE